MSVNIRYLHLALNSASPTSAIIFLSFFHQEEEEEDDSKQEQSSAQKTAAPKLTDILGPGFNLEDVADIMKSLPDEALEEVGSAVALASGAMEGTGDPSTSAGGE